MIDVVAQAEQNLAQTVSGIATDVISGIVRHKESEEYTNAISTWLDQKQDFIDWQRQNMANPQNYVSELDNRRGNMVDSLLSGVTTPGAKQRILQRFNEDFASLKNQTINNSYAQVQANQSAAFNVAYDKITAPPLPEDILDKSYIQGRLRDLVDLIDENEGKIPQLQIPEMAGQLEDEAAKSILTPYIMSHAQSVDDIDNANQIAKEFGLDGLFNVDDVGKIKKQYNEKINLQKAKYKDAIEQETENIRQEIDKIFIMPTSEFLNNTETALDIINKSNVLSVKDKEEQRKKINDRVNAISEGKTDPVTQFDPETYNKWSIKITRNPESVRESDIRNLIGMPDGVTVAQAETLLGLKRKFTEGKSLNNDVHDMYSTVLTSLKTSNMYSKDKVKNAKLAGKSQILLDKFTEQNPEATEEDYEKFFNKLIENNYEFWKGDGFSGFWNFGRGVLTVGTKKEVRRSIPQNIEKMEKEFNKAGGNKDLSEMSDEELLKRIMGK